MKNPSVAAVVAVALSGCMTVPTIAPPAPIYISAEFNESQARDALKPGPNAITGSAFMRQKGGGVVTCAGETVHLIPATPYAVQRMTHIYGNSSGGASRRKLSFEPSPAAYYALEHSTKCDAQGKFEFKDVAESGFFVATTVRWSVGYSQEGANLMQFVPAPGGKAVTVILSQ